MQRLLSILVAGILLCLLLAVDVSADPEKVVTICHAPGTPSQKTLNIPAKALGGHLAHGDTLGPCGPLPAAPPPPPAPTPTAVPELTIICHEPGTPAQLTLEVPTDALAAHLAHGDTLGPCQKLLPAPVQVPAGSSKVAAICQGLGTGAEVTVEVPVEALVGWLGHRDCPIPCEGLSMLSSPSGQVTASCPWPAVSHWPHARRLPYPY